MRFDSTKGNEVRTWILFFVGIAIAIIFALKGNPLNPWWTLVIGAFTCTAIIVSAVGALSGGITDAARKAFQEPRRDDPSVDSKEKDEPSLSIAMGTSRASPVWFVCRSNTVAI